jgi:hypothetical protein
MKSIDNQSLQLENTTSTISKITNKVIDFVSEYQRCYIVISIISFCFY